MLQLSSPSLEPKQIQLGWAHSDTVTNVWPICGLSHLLHDKFFKLIFLFYVTKFKSCNFNIDTSQAMFFDCSHSINNGLFTRWYRDLIGHEHAWLGLVRPGHFSYLIIFSRVVPTAKIAQIIWPMWLCHVQCKKLEGYWSAN